MKPGCSAMNVYVGLTASAEELGLKANNTWAYRHNQTSFDDEEWDGKSLDDTMDDSPALLFISYGNVKDPEWSKVAGREAKSMCILISFAKFDWVEKWKDGTLNKRGDEYEGIKKSLGHQMIEQWCRVHPQVRIGLEIA